LPLFCSKYRAFVLGADQFSYSVSSFLLDRSGISYVVLEAPDADLLQEINFVDHKSECIPNKLLSLLSPINKLTLILVFT
jgi:hypothetical protein